MKKSEPVMRTLDDLRACEKPFLIPKDIAPIMRCDPYNINLQAKKDPSKLGFPVSVIGSRVKIPRVGFIRWYEGEVLGQ